MVGMSLGQKFWEAYRAGVMCSDTHPLKGVGLSQWADMRTEYCNTYKTVIRKVCLGGELNLGKRFWEAYTKEVDGTHPITGDQLPEWENMREDIRALYTAAVNVAYQYKQKLMDLT